MLASSQSEGKMPDLAILDISFGEEPDMDGKKLAAIIKERYPDLPLVVSSGIAHDNALEHPEAFGFSASLVKPYAFEGLVEVLKRISGSKKA